MKLLHVIANNFKNCKNSFEIDFVSKSKKTSAQVRTELNIYQSSLKPKDFAKKYITCGKRKYDNSTSFYTDYFGDNPELLIKYLKDYHKHNGSHGKGAVIKSFRCIMNLSYRITFFHNVFRKLIIHQKILYDYFICKSCKVVSLLRTY